MWKTIVQTKAFHQYINPALIALWYLLMIFVAWKTYNLLKLYPISSDVVNISLPNIISTIGIISAILITFIFTKLYAEKSEIIERKKRIQELSAKVNAVRKIFYILFKKNQFWKKQTLDVEKIIQDIDDDYIIYNRFNQKRYTQKDLISIWDTLNLLLDSMKTKSEEFKNVEELSEQDREHLIRNMNIINEDDSMKEPDNNKLRLTLEDYKQMFWEEHYVLLSLNSQLARRNFNFLMFDLLIFVILIIAGLIFLNISTKASLTLFVNQIIVSVFIASVIDILKNILFAVRFEFKAYGIRES